MTGFVATPLALERIILDRLVVDGPRAATPQGTSSVPMDITIGYGVSVPPNDPLHCFLTLTVQLQPKGVDAGTAIPLRIEAQITGRFRIADEVPEEERDMVLRFHGCSVLYSSLRGLLAPLIGMLRVQGFVLPVINMHTVVQELMEKEQNDKQRMHCKPPIPIRKRRTASEK